MACAVQRRDDGVRGSVRLRLGHDVQRRRGWCGLVLDVDVSTDVVAGWDAVRRGQGVQWDELRGREGVGLRGGDDVERVVVGGGDVEADRDDQRATRHDGPSRRARDGISASAVGLSDSGDIHADDVDAGARSRVKLAHVGDAHVGDAHAASKLRVPDSPSHFARSDAPLSHQETDEYGDEETNEEADVAWWEVIVTCLGCTDARYVPYEYRRLKHGPHETHESQAALVPRNLSPRPPTPHSAPAPRAFSTPPPPPSSP